jgi:hypothetical protein
MSWFKPNRGKHPEELQVPQFRFLGEQDGPSERMLTERLLELFRRDRSVNVAYLARVEFDNPSQTGVALCLKTKFGADRDMVEKIGKTFGSIFGAHEHMDIVFLNDTQEAELAKVCRPFFHASMS